MSKKIILVGIFALALLVAMGSCNDNSKSVKINKTPKEKVKDNKAGKANKNAEINLGTEEQNDSLPCCNEEEEYVEAQFTDDTESIVEDEDDAESVLILQPGQSLPQPDDKPVVVDLFATWCGPCKSYGPIFDDVASLYAHKAKFVRVDIDQNPEIAAQYRVDAIPTTVILCSGKEPVKLVGLLSQSQLQEAVEQALR